VGDREPQAITVPTVSITPISAADHGSLAALFRAVAAAPAIGPGVRLQPGDLLDDEYQIERELGAGGMGVVYLARDRTLDRPVAIKLHRRQPGDDLERYLAEAMALARIGHPGVVAVFRAGVCRGQVYMAMEHVAGGNLREWLAARPRSTREIVDAFVQAGRGLAAAHAAGLVHCDFKPDNVLVGDDGRVRVGDFGLARATAAQPPGDASADAGEPVIVAGTPLYMAPEQHRGEEVGPATDQFAFCAALWEALCGEPPFRGGSVAAIARAATAGPPQPPPALPRRLRGLIARGLAPRAADRFPDMDALLARLAATQRRRRWPWLLAAAAALALAAALIVPRLHAAAPAEAADPCATAADAIDQVWNPGQRAAIERALRDPARPWTTPQWQAIDSQLDTYAADWRRRRVAACRGAATEGPERAAARAVCLDDQRDSLRAAAAVIAQARAEQLAVVDHAIEGLQPPSWCEGDRMLSLPLGAVTSDPAVTTLRAHLRDARALVWAGRLDAAGQMLDDVAHGGGGRLPALAAQFEMLRGVIAMARQQPEAERHLRAAYVAARRSQDVVAAVDAAAGMSRWLADISGRPADAELWADLSLSEAEGAHDQAMLVTGLDAMALVRELQGRFGEALALRRRQLDAALHLYGERDLRSIDALNSLAAVQDGMGDPAAAIPNYERALAAQDALLGPEHPAAAMIDANLGLARSSLGEHARAVELLRRAVALGERDDADGLDTAYSRLNLGVALDAQGDRAGAIASLRRAQPVIEKQLGADHPDVALVLQALGNALAVTGDLAGAEQALGRALAITSKALGAGHPNTALAKANLADVIARRGRIGQGRALAAEAVAALAGGDARTELIHALTVQGRIELRAGRRRDALVPLRRALELAGAVQRDPEIAAGIRSLLAEAGE
jgi:serine/threonine protein kinase